MAAEIGMADFAAIQKHLDAKQHEKALTLVQDGTLLVMGQLQFNATHLRCSAGLKALGDDSDLLHLQATLLLQLKKV